MAPLHCQNTELLQVVESKEQSLPNKVAARVFPLYDLTRKTFG